MGSVNPVIAPQIPDLLEGRRSRLDTTEAEARAAKTRKYVRAEKDVNERVARLHDRLAETREAQRFSPHNVERTVRTALRLAEMPDLEPARLAGIADGKLFTMPGLTGSWRRCLDGLEHPYTRRIRPITFDHEVAKGATTWCSCTSVIASSK